MQICLVIIPVFAGKKELYLRMEEKAVPAGSLFPNIKNLPGGFDFYEGMKEAIKSGKAEIVTTEEYGMKLGPVNVSDNMPYHLNNWVDCMRNRNVVPNGHIHTGFWHSIATIMATRAYREGKKLYWDRKNEEIVDRMPSS